MRPVLYFVLTTVSIVVAKSSEWDMFALSLTWPVTLCKFSELNKPPQKCVISSKLWTIHGLWPSARNRDHDPENCPISKPFNENEIQETWMGKAWQMCNRSERNRERASLFQQNSFSAYEIQHWRNFIFCRYQAWGKVPAARHQKCFKTKIGKQTNHIMR